MSLIKPLTHILSTALVLTLVSCSPSPEKDAKKADVEAKTERSIAHKNPVTQDPSTIDEAFPPTLSEINFQSHGARLNGIIYQANGAGPHPTAVLLHGYPGNEKNLDLAHAMRRAGYNVLFFHYRGAWGSGGNFSFSHVVEDVASAANFLREKHADFRVDPERLLFIGHSMGGFAALEGAANDEAVKCVAGIAPANVAVIAADPNTAQGVAAGADNLTMLAGWNAETALADFTANGNRFDNIALAPKLAGKSVLLIAGDKDTVLPPSVFHSPLVTAYEKHGGIELTHKVLPGDHSFSWSRIALIDTVLTWAQNCEAPTP